ANKAGVDDRMWKLVLLEVHDPERCARECLKLATERYRYSRMFMWMAEHMVALYGHCASDKYPPALAKSLLDGSVSQALDALPTPSEKEREAEAEAEGDGEGDEREDSVSSLPDALPMSSATPPSLSLSDAPLYERTILLMQGHFVRVSGFRAWCERRLCLFLARRADLPIPMLIACVLPLAIPTWYGLISEGESGSVRSRADFCFLYLFGMYSKNTAFAPVFVAGVLVAIYYAAVVVPAHNILLSTARWNLSAPPSIWLRPPTEQCQVYRSLVQCMTPGAVRMQRAAEKGALSMLKQQRRRERRRRRRERRRARESEMSPYVPFNGDDDMDGQGERDAVERVIVDQVEGDIEGVVPEVPIKGAEGERESEDELLEPVSTGGPTATATHSESVSPETSCDNKQPFLMRQRDVLLGDDDDTVLQDSVSKRARAAAAKMAKYHPGQSAASRIFDLTKPNPELWGLKPMLLSKASDGIVPRSCSLFFWIAFFCVGVYCSMAHMAIPLSTKYAVLSPLGLPMGVYITCVLLVNLGPSVWQGMLEMPLVFPRVGRRHRRRMRLTPS
ncbi:hypothetical protein KIPB_004304, partial [Kipferlia bialata]